MFRSIALGLLAFFTALPAAGAPLVQLDVIDREQGRQLPQYQHRSGRWIPGAPGHRYSVQLTNTTGERVLVVLSVDGVNAVTGETASPDQAGYLLGPWQTSQVAGWRKSHQEIAQFVFTSISDSYAARTGRPDNIGVIGIAVYREARRPPQWAPARLRRPWRIGPRTRRLRSPGCSNSRARPHRLPPNRAATSSGSEPVTAPANGPRCPTRYSCAAPGHPRR